METGTGQKLGKPLRKKSSSPASAWPGQSFIMGSGFCGRWLEVEGIFVDGWMAVSIACVDC